MKFKLSKIKKLSCFRRAFFDKGFLSDHTEQGVSKGAHHTGTKDDGDGIDAVFSQKEESADEQAGLDWTEVCKGNAGQVGHKKSQQQDGKSGGGNQCDNCRAQSGKNGLHAAEVAVLIVKMSQCQTDDKGRDDASKGTEHCTWNTCQTGADKGCRVNGDWSRSHLRNGDEVGKLSEGHQLVDVDNLVLNQRNCCISAAYTEQTNLNECKK